jgi:hypothetical protein
MTLIIDDHVLMSCLALTEPQEVRRARRRGRLFTSGLWYHRLCRALGASRTAGVLSTRLAGLPAADAGRLLGSLRHLPEAVRMVSLRDLGWPMAALLREHRLNLLHLEAVAAAQMLEATICVWEGDEAPQLRAAADTLGVPILAVPL